MYDSLSCILLAPNSAVLLLLECRVGRVWSNVLSYLTFREVGNLVVLNLDSSWKIYTLQLAHYKSHTFLYYHDIRFIKSSLAA